MKRILPLLLLFLLPASSKAQTAEATINTVLDDIHRLASEADFEGYFALYTHDAVFLGTDASERWTIEEFKQYAKPAFDRGSGWTYTPTERHVFISEDGNTAWFDERLENDGFGECRGTGALVKEDGVWKVSQYNLTVPIPNELLRDVVAQIREQESDG